MSRCQKCYTELPDGARFCGMCGSSQQLAGSLAAAVTAGTQEAIVTQDFVTTTPDTPPISPVVSLNPTRTIHPGIKHATLPEDAGSNTLNLINSEILQENRGD